MSSQMSPDTAVAAAMKLAVEHKVVVTRVISVRLISVEERVTYEPAEGGLWAVVLEEESQFGERFGVDECMVMVDDLTGRASFELTL
jgi:hypothetical protein